MTFARRYTAAAKPRRYPARSFNPLHPMRTSDLSVRCRKIDLSGPVVEKIPPRDFEVPSNTIQTRPRMARVGPSDAGYSWKESAMFSAYLFLVQWFRHYFRFDAEHEARIARGEAHPVDGDGGGVWIGFTPNGTARCYMVTDGPGLQKPVAIVWSKMNGLKNLGRQIDVGRAQYRTAHRIAANFNLAAGADRNCRVDGDGRFPGMDLRGRSRDVLLDLLQDLAFFPTNWRGRKRSDCDHFGCLYTPDSIITMLVPHDPWPTLADSEIPMLGEMNIGGGWTPVSADLKNHLDKIDPLPNKKAVKATSETLSPGQLESIENAAMTAA
jgi:hypothetical protein